MPPSVLSADEIEHRKLTRRVLFKLDLRILPILALLFLASFIDRTNIGNAGIAGLKTDAHLKGNEFNTTLAVFYASYIVVELPSNWVLKKIRANRWLALLVFVWGVVTTLMGLVDSFGSLTAVRVVLGFCEGGLLPGMACPCRPTMYKRHELQLRVGIFYASASLSGAFGGLLATAIIKMDGIGGLSGWRWIFILEGIATCLIAVIAAVVLPSTISSARFLTEHERSFALERFRMADSTAVRAPLSEPAQNIRTHEKDAEKEEDRRVEDVSIVESVVVHQEDEKFEWREVVRGLVDVQTWLTAIAYLGMIVGLYSFSLFLPTIVQGLGYSGGQAQLHTVPPYIPAVVLTVVIAYLSDRYRLRGPFILMLLPISMIGHFATPKSLTLYTGYIVSITAKTNGTRYIAVFLMATGLYPSAPCILSIIPNNTSGHYKKATCVALQLAIANCGGFVATFAYTSDQAPSFQKGHSIVLGFVVLAWVFTAINVAYCHWENRARALGNRQGNIEAYQLLWESGKTRAPIGDRHPDFHFTL
ncbi:MFS general substrate transporter [Peniophora sp. CONT]|nr:MFS general substrate transporter [Peniophora sp. CONT]